MAATEGTLLFRSIGQEIYQVGSEVWLVRRGGGWIVLGLLAWMAGALYFMFARLVFAEWSRITIGGALFDALLVALLVYGGFRLMGRGFRKRTTRLPNVPDMLCIDTAAGVLRDRAGKTSVPLSEVHVLAGASAAVALMGTFEARHPTADRTGDVWVIKLEWSNNSKEVFETGSATERDEVKALLERALGRSAAP